MVTKSSENVFSRSGWKNAISPSGSGSWPSTWGICLRIRSTPMANSRPLITPDGKKAAMDPARARPRAICISPATTTAIKNASNEPRIAIWVATTAVIPAAGPLTLTCDPLNIPTRMPPMTPARMPDSSGTPDASAIPRHKGSATRKTTRPAARSRCRVEGVWSVWLCMDVRYLVGERKPSWVQNYNERARWCSDRLRPRDSGVDGERVRFEFHTRNDMAPQLPVVRCQIRPYRIMGQVPPDPDQFCAT